ncbi:sigma-70 family RNA polymerase sigma factor [Methylobacterium sp. B4]|uniref:sigma-70 family RNA polymerase sigma factor n=1 Tax=Methylobacterium sp. B4 TaxID=1938755 RepID=UPI000D765E0E|nr:sigma-70 family RNA polymerase sigma factor [Methylobacterium sp. B4]PXW66002.1 RNA polymerase sigma-70 factor (ECF subfamily) [Methylobacterium sp. B4]
MAEETTRTASPRPREGEIPEGVRHHLGTELRGYYAAMLAEEQPATLLDLIAKLEGATSARDARDARDAANFRDGLLTSLPGLRAFAMSLAVNPTVADDLVQETLLKAWRYQAKFQPGTNLQAWLCTILRNQFYTDIRRRKREVEDADGTMAGQMVAPAAQEANSELQKVGQHLAKLPATMREALLLVGAQGLTYEAAAELIGCQVGTVKSRVSRARALLATSLGMGSRHAVG